MTHWTFTNGFGVSEQYFLDHCPASIVSRSFHLLIQYRRVTNGHTDGRTDRLTDAGHRCVCVAPQNRIQRLIRSITSCLALTENYENLSRNAATKQLASDTVAHQTTQVDGRVLFMAV